MNNIGSLPTDKGTKDGEWDNPKGGE